MPLLVCPTPSARAHQGTLPRAVPLPFYSPVPLQTFNLQLRTNIPPRTIFAVCFVFCFLKTFEDGLKSCKALIGEEPGQQMLGLGGRTWVV